MKNLVIIGAGGCGREVSQWCNDINNLELKKNGVARWNIKGFIDNDVNALDQKKSGYTIISGIDDYSIDGEDEFVCCIGNSITRQLIIDKLEKRGASFINIIHPTANISKTSNLGKAIVIYPYAIVSDNATIGNGCIINMYSSIAHDSYLGDYCTISAHCDITGNCFLDNHVFMGTSSNMVPKTKVGEHVYIGAGSTVMTRLKSNVKVMGNPAKRIKF